MSLDERREDQLIALIGRVEELEQINVIREIETSKDGVISFVEKLLPIRKVADMETLDENHYITVNSPTLHLLDANGGERTVFLPDATLANTYYVIVNTSNN